MPAKELRADLLSVGGLFGESGTHYEIPIYQRNYAWGAEQIQQLIDDVWTASQAGDENYFLGNLIVARRTPGQVVQFSTYEVIDGQQRLTTLYLLLTFLRVELSAKLTYQSRRAATEALAGLDRSDDEEGSGIHTGFKIIESHLGRLGVDDRAQFAAYLRDGVLLVRAALPDATDLNRYFEIMNTRGQQLQQVDIVKARLMSYLREDGSREVDITRACFAWIWDASSDMDSYIQMAMTPGDTQLRDRIFGRAWDRLLLTGFDELRSVWPQDGPDLRGLGGSGSVRLVEALDLYAKAADKPSTEDLASGRFESPIKFPSLLLHALKVMRGAVDDDLDENSGRLDDNKLIKMFDDEFKGLPEIDRSDRAKSFAEELLRCKLVLDNYVLKREYTQTNGDDGAWSLKRLVRGESMSGQRGAPRVNARFPNSFAPGIDEGDGAPSDVTTREVLLLQSMLRVTYTSPRTMHWITTVLRMSVHEQTQSEAAAAIMSALTSYARTKVQQALFDREEPQGFAIERVVFTYLDYILALRTEPDFTFLYRNSIEHFFPQYADREQEHWDRVNPDDAEMNMFGNLALVSVGANSKFSNNLPENKVKFQETIRQSTKLQLMARRAQSGQLWDRDAIRDHHGAMVELLLADVTATEQTGTD